MKITPPNYTQTPNDLFDHWLPLLGEAELKVLLVVMRKTFGWHKTHDAISVSQLSKMTGMLEETVIKAARSLQKKGVISRRVEGPNGKQETIYSLIINEDSNNLYPSVKPTPPLGLNPPVQTEAQKKASSPKETAAKEKETAAAFSESAKEEKQKVYACLEPLDIPLHDKIEITRMYSLPIVIKALEWALNQKSYSKGLAAAIKYACKHGLKYQAPKIKETPYEILCKHFKHGNLYHEAECHLKADAIAFSRGMKNEEVLFDKYFTWEKFKQLCESFGIKHNKEIFE